MSTTASEIEWLTHLMDDFHIQVHHPITMHCDNKAAQHIAANPVFHDKTKHIRIDCHYIRDMVLEGLLQTAHVSSQTQIADIFTKPLNEVQHHFLCSRLQLMDSPPIPP